MLFSRVRDRFTVRTERRETQERQATPRYTVSIAENTTVTRRSSYRDVVCRPRVKCRGGRLVVVEGESEVRPRDQDREKETVTAAFMVPESDEGLSGGTRR